MEHRCVSREGGERRESWRLLGRRKDLGCCGWEWEGSELDLPTAETLGLFPQLSLCPSAWFFPCYLLF